MRPLLVLCALLLSASPAFAGGSGGVLATGWGDLEDTAWLKGEGRGVYVLGHARTVYRWRSLRSSTDRVVPFSPLHQSFRFVVRDDRNRHRVSFETSVRGGADLYRGGFRGEVLYAFVELVPEGRWASVKLGRQIIATGGADGLTRFDGLSGRLVLHHLALETFAGTSLRSRAFIVPEDERDTHETGWGRDWTYGFALATSGLRTTQVRLGFQDRFRDGRLVRRHLTIDVHKGLFGIINIRGNVAVDLLQRRVGEALAGVDARPVDWLRVGVEYEHWVPTFDSGSLFSVFATDPYDSLRGHAQVRIGSLLEVHAGGGLQIYPDPLTKDGVPRPEVGRLSGTQNVGVSVHPTKFLRFAVDQRLIDGTGGQKIGVSMSGRATPFGGRLDVNLRGDIQVYDFNLQPELQGRYGGLALSVGGRPVPWMRVGVRGETIFSPWLKNDFQLAATLDFLLGIRAMGKERVAQARLEDWQSVAQAPARTPSNFAGLDGEL